MSLTSKVDLASRMSARAIVAGVFSSLALMIMFMALGAGFGLWNYDLNGFLRMDSGLWLYTFVAWAISLYISGYIAALASRSSATRDGNLHGLVTWAVASVLTCAFLFSNTGGLVFSQLTHPFYFAAFLGDVIALAAAMAGGAAGTKSEMIIEEKERERVRTLESQRLNQAYPRP